MPQVTELAGRGVKIQSCLRDSRTDAYSYPCTRREDILPSLPASSRHQAVRTRTVWGGCGWVHKAPVLEEFVI